MSLAQKITEAEFEVMRVLWEKSPLTGGEIVAALEPATGWKTSTILTLVRRLKEKRVLKSRKSERGILYAPQVTREECLAVAGSSFVDRFFDGALLPMLVHFTRTRKLSPQERDALKRMLDEDGEK